MEKKLTQRDIDLIQAEPETTTNQALGDRFGITNQRVSQLRIAARAERAQMARAVKTARIERELPNALEALARTLTIAREQLEATKDPEWVRETRQTAIAMLDRLAGPEEYRRSVEGLSDEELERERLRVMALAARELGMEIPAPAAVN